MEKSNLNEFLKALAERWPSAGVAREEVDKFSGGMLSPKYMGNLDSRGLGPVGRIRVGRKVVYPVNSLLKWIEGRAEAL
jgi:hypothetical protein